jgi:hypothetical protein
MKLSIHMNMPSGKNDGTHQVILDVPGFTSLLALADNMVGDIIYGDQLVYERADNGTRTWTSRGPLIVNFAHIGKIAEYYEGKS